MRVVRLESVDGFLVFDLDDVENNAGGTRFAPDVTEEETVLLARAMTYKFAALGERIGGAKAGIRGDVARRDAILRRFCEEVRPLVESRRFLTGPDLGTSEADFAQLRTGRALEHVMAQTIGGIPFENLLAGFGVVAAAEAALGSLDGRTVALEGFGKVGGGVAREAVRRGARIVAVSDVEGCVANPRGLDVELLLQLRRVHGDEFVWHLGLETMPPSALFEQDVDVLVPGARPGVITPELASWLRARSVVPAANAPYTVGATDALHSRGIQALADFVCNAGGVIGYLQLPDTRPGEVFRTVERRIQELVAEAGAHPDGPYEGACALAEDFLRSWLDPGQMPDGRPLVGAVRVP